jgi:hypothetical protein
VIIKSVRVATKASQKRFRDHLLRGAENDAVALLRGTETDIGDLFADAKRGGARYAVRHWIVAPAQTMTRDQAQCVVDMLAREFSFAPSRAVIIEHEKRRATGDAFGRHWHIAVGEVDAVTGRVLSSSHDHPRHEYVARRAEIAFGHAVVPGPHTRSVMERMRSEGHVADALRLQQALDAAQPEKPREAFTTPNHQAAKRQSIDLPAIRIAVQSAWASTTTRAELIEALGALGLGMAPGDKAGEWIVKAGDHFLGSLRRLARVPKSEFQKRMEQTHVRPAEPATSDDRQDYRPAIGGHPEASSGVGGGSAHLDDADRTGSASFPAERADSLGQHDKSHLETGTLAGGAPRSDDGAGRRESIAASGSGALTSGLDAFRDGMARLLNTLAPLAMESLDSVNHILSGDEASARRALLEANRQQPVATIALDAARRSAESAASDHASLTRRLREIDGQIADAEAPRTRSWRDLFRSDGGPQPDIEALRSERNAVAGKQRQGERRLLSAQAAVARLERQHQTEVAAEGQRQRQAIVDAKARLAEVQQARRLVVLLPRLAYCRPPYIRSLGARVRRTRLQFGSPNATNIWGLPVNGPGTGNRR